MTLSKVRVVQNFSLVMWGVVGTPHTLSIVQLRHKYQGHFIIPAVPYGKVSLDTHYL